MLCACRHSSPLGGSTVMTSAPKSDKITAALGPAMKLARSTTFSPEKMLSLGMAVLSDCCVRPTSPTLKLRRALLEESGGAFLLVFRGGTNAEVGSFEGEALMLAGLQSPVRGLQGELHSDRSVSRDLLQDRLRTLDQAGRGNDFVDETNAIGVLRGNRFAREDELQRTALSYQARQALRSTTARQ